MSSNDKNETPITSITDGKQLNGPNICMYPPCPEDIPDKISNSGLCLGHHEMVAFLEYWLKGYSINDVSLWNIFDQLTDNIPMLMDARTKKPVFRKNK